MKNIIEKYIEHKIFDGEHQIWGTSTLLSTQVRQDRLDGRIDHLEEEAQKEEEQQDEMVQSIDNDNQESARLLQEMMEETSGGGYRHTAEPEFGTGGYLQ